jgi:hypothetical protein
MTLKPLEKPAKQLDDTTPQSPYNTVILLAPDHTYCHSSRVDLPRKNAHRVYSAASSAIGINLT